MTWIELVIVFALGTLASFGVVRWARRSEADTLTRSVRFAPGLREVQVKALLDVIAALPRRTEVAFRTVSRDGQLEFLVTSSPSVISTLESAFSGIAPEVTLIPLDRTPHEGGARWRISWGGPGDAEFRSDANATASASLLGTLASTGAREAATLRHVLRPGGPVPAGRSNPTSLRKRDKTSAPLLCVASEVEIATGHSVRANALLSRILTPLRSRVGRGGLRASRSRIGSAASSMLRGPAVVSTEEMPGILGWPIDSPAVAGIAYDAAPRLAPSRSIPSPSDRAPRVFGVDESDADKARKIAQPTAGATCHSLIVGPSGSGKSWLMTNLIVGESKTDHAIVLVDMKGDTASDVLARLHPRRHKDVVILAPAENGPVPGLRTFSNSPELSADLWLSVFKGLFPENFGVRSQRYLRMGLSTLSRSSGATIAELPKLFQDGTFRRSRVSKLDDPLLVGEWAAFEQLSIAQQSEHLLPALGKVSEVLARQSVRATLAQSKPRITIADAVSQRKVVIVSLPPGVIGQPAAQLLGALVIFEVWQAVMAKQSLAPGRRDHVALYIDEPAVLGSLPTPLDTLLETARGMNCGITLAAQSLRQLPDRVSRAALTNAATIATFRPSQADAVLVAHELPGLSADQLQRLDPFTIALRLGLSSGVTAPVCTVRTLPLSPTTCDPRQLVQRSADQYGMDPNEVDVQLRNRLNGQTEAPIVSIGEIGDPS